MTAADSPRVLVFSATTGFRHASIPAGVGALRELAVADGFEVDATEDPTVFTPRRLDRYAAVVFMNTSGTLFDETGRSALRAYLSAGGGYVGVHLAAGTEYDWPYYGGLVGARFDRHPEVQPAIFQVEDRAHPATSGLPVRWHRVDELYNYRHNPRPDVHVLMTLDESSYTGGTMGPDHPITWCHTYQGGRVFYTGAGHTDESYDEPGLRALLLGGLRYAAGTRYADDRPEHGYARVAEGDITEWISPAPVRAGSIRFGWRSGPDGSGVAARVGVPPSDDPADAALAAGVEVPMGGEQGTPAAAAPVNPVGEWNSGEITISDGRVEVFANGRRVAEITKEIPAGHVWFGVAGRVPDAGFRDVRVR